MEGPRGARPEEFNQVMDLINTVFRINRGHEPTMALEFPLLLNIENVDNMRIMKAHQVISTVNFMTHTIYIDNIPVTYGAIGAVCTDGAHEKKGYSSLILEDVEKCMDHKQVAICLISGTRSLYTRRQAVVLKSFKRYDIEPENVPLEFDVSLYQKDDLKEMNRLYQKQGTKYKRSFDEFLALIDSGTHPWGNYTYERLVLKKNGHIKGYLVLRMMDKGDHRIGEVVEAVGNPKDILNAIKRISHDLNLNHTSHYVHVKDELNHMDEFSKPVIDNQQGVIKIINHQRLVDELSSYFQKYLDSPDQQLSVTDDAYGLVLGDEKIYLKDLESMTKLFFDIEGMTNLDLSKTPNLKKLFDKALPLPLPWTKNLNYQ